MTDTPVDSLIPYDEIVQDALRSVVQRVLERIDAEGGLPGSHHFYIAFRTRYPGVEMPKHLLERYPEEMTIVIQHREWDLKIDNQHFEIGLSFNQVPAKLSIPFDAVTGFVDPAVDFTLQFPMKEGEVALEPEPAPPAVQGEPGSNVVTMDAFRKK
ncbi:MAG: SspB family protein [Polymorphobacter sp.]